MKKRRNEMPTQEELLELFTYDGKDLYWKIKPNGRYAKGSKVGSAHIRTKHLSTRIKGVNYKVHRLVWVFVNGSIPKGMEVHHKNEDPSDNRIENLELMSPGAHTAMHSLGRKCKPGKKLPVGVTFYRGKYVARVGVNGKNVNLGTFKTLEEALDSRNDYIHKYLAFN